MLEQTPFTSAHLIILQGLLFNDFNKIPLLIEMLNSRVKCFLRHTLHPNQNWRSQ